MRCLNDLRRALITVIVRYYHSRVPFFEREPYHSSLVCISEVPADRADDLDEGLTSEWMTIPVGDSEPQDVSKPTSIKSDETSTEEAYIEVLFAKPSLELKSELSAIITKSTQQKATRLSLLQYLHHIIFLLMENGQAAIESVGDESLTCPLKTTLVEFLTHLQVLYRMNLYQSLVVAPMGESAPIYGFAGVVSKTQSKIALSIDALIMRPLRIKQTTEEATISLMVECILLRQKVCFLSELKQRSEPVVLTNKPSSSEAYAHLEASTMLMATQLAEQKQEIDCLKRQLSTKPTVVQSVHTGGFRFLSSMVDKRREKAVEADPSSLPEIT